VGSAEVAVVVADEAVLALSGYKTPDPVAVFYSPRWSDARDVGMRDRIILGEPELSRPVVVLHESRMQVLGAPRNGHTPFRASAGAMAKPSAAPLALRANETVLLDAEDARTSTKSAAPIALRTDFSPLALFAPRVRTDASG